MERIKLVLMYLGTHAAIIVGLVAVVRFAFPGTLSSPGTELSILQAGLIAAIWHLPLTAFIYRFAGGDLMSTLGSPQ